MSINQEYYVLEKTKNNKQPLLKWSKHHGIFCKGKPVSIDECLAFENMFPELVRQDSTDFYFAPEPVIAARIKEFLLSKKIPDVQFLKAQIRISPEIIYKDYYLLHLYKEIACLDKKKSKIKAVDELFFIIEKIALDEKILELIPLKERLFLRLAEQPNIYLIHFSLKKEISTLNPQGVSFVSCAEWSIHNGTITE